MKIITHTIIWFVIFVLYLMVDRPKQIEDIQSWIVWKTLLILLLLIMYHKSTKVNKRSLEYQAQKEEKPDFVVVLLILIAGFSLNLLINNVYEMIFGDGLMANDKLILKNLGLYIPFYISVAIISPIIEEIVFRGYFYILIDDIIRSFVNKYDRFKNNELVIKYSSYIIISSAVFGMLHKQDNFFTFITYFAFGAILALTFLITKRIWPGIIFHMINNTIASLSLIYLSDNDSNNLSYSIISILVIITAILLVKIYPLIKNKIMLNEQK